MKKMDKNIENIIADYRYCQAFFFGDIEEYLKHYGITETDDNYKILTLKISQLILKDKHKQQEIEFIFNNYSSFKAVHKDDSNRFIIYHKSTKNDNTYQLSFFDKHGAYADIARHQIKDMIAEFEGYYNNYDIVEVI